MKYIRHNLGFASFIACSSFAVAGTDLWFTPLTESAPVTLPNSSEELGQPWVTPPGISQTNLTSMDEIEGAMLAGQSVVRAPLAGTSASMWDMVAYDPTGQYIFIPHETPWGAGCSRYDIVNDFNEIIFQGDGGGFGGDWSNDYAAFDPARFTPNGTVFLGEEWSGEGRIIEVLNPMAAAQDIRWRELQSIANVAHEGINFSKMYDDTIYYIDEWNSGSIYKFVMKNAGDYTVGQTFVLSVNSFKGNPADLWNDESNAGQSRTGNATWMPITDRNGKAFPNLTDPFRNGPTNDPRSSSDTRGGRVAADEVGGTPFGRPEDMVVSTIGDREVIYFCATSERTVYSVEMRGRGGAKVGILASADTPRNLGQEPTTGVLNSPDNLAIDALGNIYIIEDAPNGSDTGGDIWFARDADSDGVAESLDHFMSIRVDGSEATGMIFNPANPLEYVVAVQHPDSTDLANVPDGFGDALWKFDLSGIANQAFVEALAAE